VKFTLDGRIMSKKNNMVKTQHGPWFVPSHEYCDWERDARWVVKMAWRRSPTEKPVKITFVTNLRNDIDGLQTSLLDMMEGLVYRNDNQVVRIDGTKIPKAGKPYKTEIEVEVMSDNPNR